jgi:hypothetical protein
VAALLALALAACQPAPAIETTDPRVAAGPAKSCADLEISAVRCTLLTLRAAAQLDDERPDHAEVTAQAMHEAVEPVAGQSPLPDSTVTPAVVVFTLADGSRIGVPLLCPREPSAADRACDPRVQ